MNGASQYCLLVTPVTVILRDWKTCFSLLFYRTFFYPHIFDDFFFFFFGLNLGDSIFSSRQAKLMAVQELIVQACAWLPVGEWMWIRVRLRFTMTCFFSGHWKWRKGHGRVLNTGLYLSSTQALKRISIQNWTKGKIILHIRDDSISNASFFCLKKSLWKVTVC